MPLIHLCTCTECEGQNWVSGPLEREFRVVVSHLVGAGNRTYVLYKSSKCSKLLKHLSRPHICHKKKNSVFIVWIFFFIIQSLIHSFWLQPHWPMSLRCPCQLASMSVTSRRQQGKKREGLGVTFPVPSLFGCCVHSSCVHHSSVPLVPLSLQVEIVAASCCPGCLGTRWWSLHLQRVVIPQESHSLILWSLGLSVLSPSRSPASLDADPSTMV